MQVSIETNDCKNLNSLTLLTRMQTHLLQSKHMNTLWWHIT